mmetsp:Transcript_16113/g.27192  ORF Transcript_16113/g.27192 Transcript_16113/m.27192 type:complete len:80 (+) Transcript_16113:84-323(+)
MSERSYEALCDFDWSLRMVLSSDKLSGLGKPLLQLKLDTTGTSKCDSDNKREHLVELDKNELNKLLKELKNAQAVVQRR